LKSIFEPNGMVMGPNMGISLEFDGSMECKSSRMTLLASPLGRGGSRRRPAPGLSR